MRIDANRNESMNRSIETSIIPSQEQPKSTISIEKESLQLGVAAGYISRSLYSIEDSLARIETLMPSKEWISLNLTPKLEEIQQTVLNLRDVLSSHERNEEKRFEILLEAITKLKTTASSLPEPVKTEILSTVKTLKSAALSPKMQQILEILKERKEISYNELAEKLGITTDGLRGLLSRMIKVCDEIERFERDNKGWVRLKAIQYDLNRNESMNQPSESEIKSMSQEYKGERELTDLP
jgi:plasmid maintenance system antidote protein VapI